MKGTDGIYHSHMHIMTFKRRRQVGCLGYCNCISHGQDCISETGAATRGIMGGDFTERGAGGLVGEDGNAWQDS